MCLARNRPAVPERFEQHVGAYWLAQLLVRSIPPILIDSMDVLHLRKRLCSSARFLSDEDYSRPSKAAKTQACPWRLGRVIPSTWPFRIICAAQFPESLPTPLLVSEVLASRVAGA